MKRILFILAATALLLASCDQPTDSPKAPAAPTISVPTASVPTALGDAPGIATGFGTGGVATFGSSGNSTSIFRVRVDSSNRILAIQYEMSIGQGGSIPTTKLVRFTEAGSLDTSFGSGGYFVPPTVATIATALGVTTSGSPSVSFQESAVDADGSVYLSGQLYSGVYGSATLYTAFLVKVTSTGSLDTSFGTNGYLNLANVDDMAVVHSLASGVVVSFKSGSTYATIVEKVSAAGVAGPQCTVEGVPTGQTLNVAVPTNGQIGEYSNPVKSLLSPDGKYLYVPVYLVTTASSALTRTLKVAKVDLTGNTPALVSAYGTSGYAKTDLTPYSSSYGFTIYGGNVVDDDGNVIILAKSRSLASGSGSQTSAGFRLVRFKADGTYDTAFDSAYHYPTGDVSPVSALLAGGKYVMGGFYRATGSSSTSGCLIRFNPTTGVQDTGYGTNGILTPLSSLNASSKITSLTLDRGSILTVGNKTGASSAGSMPSTTTVMVRLQ